MRKHDFGLNDIVVVVVRATRAREFGRENFSLFAVNVRPRRR